MLIARRSLALLVASSLGIFTACGDRDAQSDATPKKELGVLRQGLSPQNTVPPAQTTNEDSPLIFTGTNAIVVNDTDSSTITVQIDVTNGTFLVPILPNGPTITGNGTNTVIMTGVPNSTAPGPNGITQTLNGSRFNPAANYFGAATLQMNSSDPEGGVDTDVINISITSFNDAPTNTSLAGAQPATEDTPRSFSLPINDPDIGTADMVVTLTASNGTTITLPTTTGLTFQNGTTNPGTTINLRGSLPNINAALNGLTITPPLNFIGTSTLVITADDLGSSGAGQAGTDNDTTTISWAAVNDSPVNVVPGALTTVEETNLVLSGTNKLSTTDVDVTSALLQVTLSANGGTLTLGNSSVVTFTTGDGTTDATMTFTGVLADINTALDNTTFSPNANFAGPATISLITNDLGNSGSGGARQDVDNVTVNVTGVNDAPVNTVPLAQVINEDVVRVFSSGNGNILAVEDVDAPTLQVTVAVTPSTTGTLSLGNRNGLTFQAGDGISDTSTTFTGTLGALNFALNGLSFTPAANYFGTATITLTTTDLGATGTGGTKTDADTVSITIDSVNDAPDAVNDTRTLAEDSAATTISPLTNDTFAPDTGESLTILSIGTAANGTATLSGNNISYVPNANFNGNDSFSYTVSDGNGGTDTATVIVTVTSVNDNPTAVDDSATVLQNSSATNVSVLSNDSTAPDVNETLTISAVAQPTNGTVAITGSGTGLTYAPNTGYTGTDTFTYTITDGSLTATATVTVTVSAVNTKPVNSLPGLQRIVEDTQATFSSSGGNAITVSDSNHPNLTVQVTVTNGTFALGSITNLTVTGNGSATATAQGTIAALNAGLNNARFSPASNFNGAATLTITTSDVSGESDTDVLSLSVDAVNDAPFNAVPAGVQTVTEDVPKTFTNILISDVDVGAAQLIVTLAADNGTLITLPTGNGLQFSAGSDGVADAAMTFTGTLTAINSALNGVTITPPANFIGTSTLTITSSDQGNTGSGPTGQDIDTISFNWAAVNDAPVNVVPLAQSTTEEVALTFASATGNGLSAGDVDISAGFAQMTLSATGGTLTLGSLSGLSFTAGDGTGDTSMTFSGTMTALNSALEGTVFTPAQHFSGAAAVTLTTNDLGNSGAGGARQDVDTVTVNVSGVNDAPTNVVPATQSTNEDVARIFGTANGNAITVADVDAPTLQVSLAVTNGTLTLPSKAGLTFQAGDGTTDTSMTFTGTVGALNTAMNGLSYAPTAHYFGTATLTVLTSDLGATGTGGAQSRTDSITINVTSVNDAPDAVNDTRTMAEDSAAIDIAVSANDTATPDSSETLDVTSITQPSNGTAILGTNDVITYQPAAHFNGNDSFSYTISDGNGGTDTATVSVTVTPVNDAPTAANDSATVLQNSGTNTIGVLSNDSAAPDLGETLTITAFTAPTNGTVTIGSGGLNLTYQPASTFTGTDTFTYTISDGNGGTATATVTVTVAAVNENPVNTLPEPQQLIEDTQLTFSTTGANPISVTDANSPTLTVQIAVTNGTFSMGSLTNLTVTGNNSSNVTIQGTIANINAGLNSARYSPNANFNGSATLTMNTSDSTGKSDVDVLTITVTSVNDFPVNNGIVPAVAAVEDTPETFAGLTVTDVDVGAAQLKMTITADNGTVVTLPTTSGLSFSLGTGTANASMIFTGTLPSINAALNGLTVTSPTNFIGSSTLVITTDDQGFTGSGGARVDSDTMTLTWASDNDRPNNTVPPAQTVAEEGTLTLSSTTGNAMSTSDVDLGAGLMLITVSATNGTLTLGNTGGVTFATGDGTSDTTMTFSGTLANVNTALDGTTFTPNANFVGAATVTLTANDQGNTGGGGARNDVDAITVNVTGVNDAPVNTVPGTQFITEDTQLPFSATAGNLISTADVDAAPAALQVTLSASSGTVRISSGVGLNFQAGAINSDVATMTFTGTVTNVNAALATLRFTPTLHFVGTAGVTVLTKDLGSSGTGGALQDEDTVFINVSGLNDNPTAVADTFSVDEDSAATTLNVLANDSDAPDTGETLTITSNPALSPATAGTISRSGNVITFQPAADFYGNATFSYTISDGNGGTATATVTVTVVQKNDPPRATDDTLSVQQNAGAPATVQVLANDSFLPDPTEALTITSITTPGKGTAAISGTAVTYQPNPTVVGLDSFQYTISDPSGATATATVYVTINPVNFTPVAFADTASTPEDTQVVIGVTNNDQNLGNTPIVLTIVTNPSVDAGTVAVISNPDGGILPVAEFTPVPNFYGSATFRYQIQDTNSFVDGGTTPGETSQANVTVTITPVNDVLVANPDTATTPEDTTVKIDVRANDTGAVDGTITIAISTPPPATSGTATVQADKTINFVPASNYFGTATFNYSITDTVTGQPVETTNSVVTVNVTPVNDSPEGVSDTSSAKVGVPVDIDVVANDRDVDGDALTVTAVTVTSAQGTATIVANKVRYTAAAGLPNPIQFPYTISDGDGGTGTGTVSVAVGVDTDNDGLIDFDEAVAGTNPNVADSDKDGVSDGLEVNLVKSNPLDVDSDDDGLTDAKEDPNFNGALDPNETDPNKADTDGDGVQDGTELGLTAPQAGLGDAGVSGTNLTVFVKDLEPSTKTDPQVPDTDKGGLTDGEEDVNFNGRVDPGEKNPNNPRDDRPESFDGDGDGVPDATDNCAFDTNSDQSDADKDGIGDICDGETPKNACGCGVGLAGASATNALFGILLLGLFAGLRRRKAS